MHQDTLNTDRAWVDGTTISYTNYGPDQDKGSVPWAGGYLFLFQENGNSIDTWWIEPQDPLNTYSITESQWAYRYGIAEIPLSYFSISDLSIDEGSTGSVTISRTGGSDTVQNIVVTSNNTTASNSDYTSICLLYTSDAADE